MADVNWNLAVTPDPFKQIAEGRDYSRSIFDQAALLKAGSQYAAGDPASAANTVASRGDFATAGKLQDYATNREAGNLYAGGDYSGAGKALARGGNLTGAETLADKQMKLVDDQQKALGRTGQFYDAAIKQGLDPVQAWNLVKRQLQAAQVPPDRIADFEQIDPAKRGAIMSHIGDQKVEFQKTDDGKLYQFMNGQLVQTYGGDGGPYRGTSPDATDLNNLLRGVKDPAFRSTPEYAAAWNRQNAQKDQIINGKFVSIPGNVGSWAPAPGAYQGAPAPAPAAAPPNEPPPSVPPAPTPTPLAPGSEPLPPGVTSRVAPINPPPPPTRRIDRPQVPAETPPTPAASAQPGPGAPNVRVADIPGLEPRGTVRDLTPKELYDRGFGPGARGQINTQTGEISIKQQSTPDERKTAGYSKRVDEAAQNLARLEQQGIIKPTAQILLSEQNGIFKLVLSNPKDRQFVQASKEWLAPILRKDTGAAVTDKEFDEYSYIYIPRAEDTPEVLAQKAAARRVVEDALYAEAGSAYADMFGARPARVKPNAQRGPYAPGKGQPFIPKPSIDALRQHPQRAAEFDKKYGAGAAKSVLGR